MTEPTLADIHAYLSRPLTAAERAAELERRRAAAPAPPLPSRKADWLRPASYQETVAHLATLVGLRRPDPVKIELPLDICRADTLSQILNDCVRAKRDDLASSLRGELSAREDRRQPLMRLPL